MPSKAMKMDLLCGELSIESSYPTAQLSPGHQIVWDHFVDVLLGPRGENDYLYPLARLSAALRLRIAALRLRIAANTRRQSTNSPRSACRLCRSFFKSSRTTSLWDSWSRLDRNAFD